MTPQNRLRRFAADSGGATAIEYCLIASFIGVVIVAAVTQIGADLAGWFQILANAL